MDRPAKLGDERPGESSWRSKLASALLGAGLCGSLWSVETSTQGAAPQARLSMDRSTYCSTRRSTRLLATPVRFDELIRLLDDPRPAIRLDALNCLETLNRPAKDTLPALRRRFDDPSPLVRVHAVRVAIRAGMPAQEGVPIAAQLLLPNQPDVCCPAAQILGAAGPGAGDTWPQLQACLAAPSIWVRLNAAQAALRIDASDTAALNVLRSAREGEPGAAREFAAAAVDNAVNGLIRQLGRPDVESRIAAAIRLEQLGTAAQSATPALVGRFADPHILVRAHAARAALRTGAPRRQIIAVASKLLVPAHIDALHVAASILVEIGPEATAALPRLHKCLNDSSVAVRLYAAEAALRINPHDQPALNELHAGTESRETDVRFFSVNALGSAVTVNDEAVFALNRSLADANPKVATAAAIHLSRTAGAERRYAPDDAVTDTQDFGSLPPELAARIDDLSHSNAAVRRAAAIQLSLSGRAACQAVPALTTALGDPDPATRLHAAQAIWEIERNGYSILPVLVDLLLTNSANTRIGAAYALGRMGSAAKDTVPWLAKLLNGDDTIDRLLLAESIVQIDPTHAVALELLLGGLHAPDADVRYLSAVALGAAPPARRVAVEPMMRLAVADRSFHVRCAAHETLNQFQRRHVAAPGATPVTLGSDILPAGGTETLK